MRERVRFALILLAACVWVATLAWALWRVAGLATGRLQ